jgi:antirestriction protein ArdC
VREDQAAYISSWLNVVKDDERLVFPAARHAQRGADYLYTLQPKSVEMRDKKSEAA